MKINKTWPIFAFFAIGFVSIFWFPFLVGNGFIFDRDIHTEYFPLQKFLAYAYSIDAQGWWNNFSAFGHPLLGDGHPGIYYLPAMVLRLMGASPEQLNLFLLLHVIYCFFFTCLLARELGATIIASLVSAVVFTFSGYQTGMVNALLYGISIFHTPALFYFLIKVTKRGSFRDAFWFGVIFSQFFSICYYPFIFNTLVALLFYFLFACDYQHYKIWLKPLLFSSLIGILFSLPQLLPSLQFLGQSLFSGGGSSYNSIDSYLHPKFLLSFFFPLIWGPNDMDNPTGREPITNPENQYFDFPELHNYIGLLPFVFLALAIFQIRSQSKLRKSFFILGLFSLVMSLGQTFSPLYKALIYLPLFNYFKDPAKWSVHLILAMALLSGLGLEFFLSSCNRFSRRFLWSSLLLLPLLLALTFLMFLPTDDVSFFLKYRFEENHFSPLFQYIIWMTVSILCLLLPLKFQLKGVLSLVVIFLNLMFVEAPLIPKVSKDFYVQSRSHLEELKRGASTFRSVNGVFPLEKEVRSLDYLADDVGSYHQIPTLGLTSSFVTKEWEKVRDWAEGKGLINLQRFQDEESIKLLMPFLRAMNVGAILNKDLTIQQILHYRPRAYLSFNPVKSKPGDELKTFLNSCEMGNCLDAIVAEDMTFAPSHKDLIAAKIEKIEPENVKLSINAPAEGLLVYLDQYFTGWEVTVNGEEKKLIRVNGLFKGVRIEKTGNNVIEFIFRPPLYVWSVCWFWLCWISALVFLCTGKRYKVLNENH